MFKQILFDFLQSESLIASEAERKTRMQDMESHLAAAKSSLAEKVRSRNLLKVII